MAKIESHIGASFTMSNSVSEKAARVFLARFPAPEITLHALRHTHASQLIDADIDVVTISKRLGHANPTVTLKIYCTLFPDERRQGRRRDQCGFGSLDAPSA